MKRHDPILDELHRVREDIGKAHDFDVRRIAQTIREHENESSPFVQLRYRPESLEHRCSPVACYAKAMLPEELRTDTALFWDAGVGAVDPERHAPYVIGRVLSLGTLRQTRALVDFYGYDRLRSFFLEGGLRHVDPRAISFWLLVLGLTREECERRSSLPRKRTSWND